MPSSGLATIFFLFFALLTPPSSASPPPDPVHCIKGTSDCTVTNGYGSFPDRSTCHASQVVYPSSENELLRIVAKATAFKKKMKVITRFSHSVPKLMCPGGSDGVLISTRNLNRVINVNTKRRQITVESGITLKDLIEAASKANLALPYSPYWFGLTLGGMLSTGAHGSSLRGKGSAVHEYVIGMRLVIPVPAAQNYSIVKVLKYGDRDLDAAKVSLGVLGVISQVTLQLQPMFKRSLTFSTRDDSDFAEQAATFGLKHEFADIIWYPAHKKVMYRIDDRVPVNVPGDGDYAFVGLRPTPTSVLIANRLQEDTLEATRNADARCLAADLTNMAFSISHYGLTNNGLVFMGYPVIGYQNKIQASGGCAFGPDDALLTLCPWDPRIRASFLYSTGISIQLNRVKDFIYDLQKLRDLNPKAFCGLDINNGILMRYVKASSAYLGKPSDMLDFDITFYRSRDPNAPRLYEDFLEEVEQMSLFKYNGLPHWGKNRNLAFNGIIRKYAKSRDFLKVMKQYDPDGLFSSEWSDQILGLAGSVVVMKDRCALEGLCVGSYSSPARDRFRAPVNRVMICRRGFCIWARILRKKGRSGFRPAQFRAGDDLDCFVCALKISIVHLTRATIVDPVKSIKVQGSVLMSVVSC